MPRRTDHPDRINIRIRTLAQLFNSLDPSPFHEKDLDSDAEQFIVESAEEFPLDQPLELVVHLGTKPDEHDPHHLILTSVHHNFRQRAEYVRLEFRRLMRRGQVSLFIGFTFLAACFTASELLDAIRQAPRLVLLLRESLIIAGWVAMWRPMEIYLYDWWPLRRQLRLMRKLAAMPIRIVLPPTGRDTDSAG